MTSSGLSSDIKLASKNFNSEDRYNVLDSGMELNPIQKGIIQEDVNTPNEDNYYSTARGHKLIMPIRKRLSQNVGNHLYEALSEEGTNLKSNTNNYDQIQLRHNTFTSQTKFEKQKTAVVRSQSAVGRTEEILDPMYDEPFVKEPANDISSKSLFDDPKYAYKDDRGQSYPPEQRRENVTQPQGQEIGGREAASRKTQ